MTALVSSGHSRAALCAVRSIGRAGIAVAVGAPMRPALAMWSRYATATLLLPDATKNARKFAEVVAEEVEARRALLVLCATDAELWALSRWRDKLPESARRVLPPHDAVARSLDRTTLHDLARSLGIPCLDTLRVDGGGEVEPVLRKAVEAGFPAMVRSLVPWEEREDGTRREAERISVHDIAGLRRLLYEQEELSHSGCLIEPHPKGRYLGYGTVCDGGAPLVEIFRERIRERTALSGVSTVSRTIQPDPGLRELAKRLLRALSWQGPAMVECLRTEDGVLRLVTVIGRFWGSLNLAVEAGVDVPLLCYRLAEGSLLPDTMRIAKPGVSMRWVMGDMEQAINRFRAPSSSSRLRDRFKAFSEIVDPRVWLTHNGDVYDPTDPLPFAYEISGKMRSDV